MNEPLNDKTLHDALLAVADGEANAAQREQAFAAMAERPGLARFVLEQQRLRDAVKRSMVESATAPAGLRGRIEAQLQANALKPIAAVSPAAPKPIVVTASAATPQPARLGPWLPAAIAAMLFIASGALFVASRQATERIETPHASVQNISQIVSNDELESLTGRHVSCSRLLASLDDSVKFPTEVKNLPKAIGDYLGRSPYGALDLTALGYRFDGAGPCSIPGSQSVHLLFRPIDRTRRDDALSLWVQPDNGTLKIKADTIYEPSGEDAIHPIVVWKHADMVYYLVGDDGEMVTKAANQLSHHL